MIRILASLVDAMRAHAAASYPHECCGVLVGRAEVAEAAAGPETAETAEATKAAERVQTAESAKAANGAKAAGEREALQVIPVENAREDERTHRYLIPPEVMAEIDTEAIRNGRDIVGFYHSHPDHPAEPSAFDREHAWPWYTYLIIPVKHGEPGTARAWRLADDRATFEAEPINVEEGL